VPATDDDGWTGCIGCTYGRTLFVETGAGSGRSRCLVDRVVAIVLTADLACCGATWPRSRSPRGRGRELRGRLPVAFETALAAAKLGSEAAGPGRQAIADLDTAAIGTLHAAWPGYEITARRG